jgi:type I restriction enzyme S subunit
MSEWKEYKISEVIDEISMGPFGSNIKVDNFIDSGVPVLNGSNLQGFKLNEDSFNYVSQEKADSLGKANAHRGDVVITHRGTLGQIIYIPEDSKFKQYVISQSQFRLKLKKDIIRSDFFVYFFHTRLGQHRIMMNASQVGVPALARPTSTFKEVNVPVPPIEIQKKVMAVLSSLDDKIEVNRRINDNLEQQAQTLFKSWFVDFEPFKNGEFVESELGMIPKGWRVEELENICTIKYGKGLGKNDLTQKGFPVFGGNGIIGFYTQYLYELPQILVSCRGAASGKIIESLPQSYVTSNSLVLELKDRFYYNYLKFLLLSSPLYDYATGSAQPQITIDNIKGVKILLPLQEAIQKMNPTLENIGNIQRTNEQESRRLSELRDTLLPKLMSGELKVNEIA